MYIYVAGPYSKGDVGNNVRRAIKFADLLVHLGHVPFVPHLYHFWHIVRTRSWEQWMALDYAWVAKCDVLVKLYGQSAGAELERRHATELGIEVIEQLFDEADELFAHRIARLLKGRV